jgi:hypothetical protein
MQWKIANTAAMKCVRLKPLTYAGFTIFGMTALFTILGLKSTTLVPLLISFAVLGFVYKLAKSKERRCTYNIRLTGRFDGSC